MNITIIDFQLFIKIITERGCRSKWLFLETTNNILNETKLFLCMPTLFLWFSFCTEQKNTS